MKNQPQPPSKKKQSNDYVKYSSMGFQMIFIIALGVVIGWQLDKHFGHAGQSWFTLGFTLAFVILAMAWMIRQITQQ